MGAELAECFRFPEVRLKRVFVVRIADHVPQLSLAVSVGDPDLAPIDQIVEDAALGDQGVDSITDRSSFLLSDKWRRAQELQEGDLLFEIEYDRLRLAIDEQHPSLVEHALLDYAHSWFIKGEQFCGG